MNPLFLKIAWRAALYPALALAAVSFTFFWLYAHPRRFVGPYAPADFGLKAEELKLKTSDGVELDAWFIPHKTSRQAVVVCHGYPMDKSDVLGLTVFLARKFNVVYFDFRATGRSGGFFSTGGAKEVLDIDAALAFLASRGLGPTGAFGFSMGGSAVLLSRNPAIKARALDAPFSDLSAQLDDIFSFFGVLRRPLVLMMKGWSRLVMGVSVNAVSPAANTAAFAAPMLLIHGEADTVVRPRNSLDIKAANPAAELWLIKGAGHGENYATALSKYENRVTEFFSLHLR